jgi:hypothetical protein
MAQSITGQQITSFQLLTLYYALSLEAVGLKRRGESALSIVKRTLGFKGTTVPVFAEMGTMLVQQEILDPEKHEKNLRRLRTSGKITDEQFAKYMQ